MRKNEVRLITGVSQDGASFYDDIAEVALATYHGLVKNDYDVEGAYAARLAFVRDYPEYGFVVISEEASPNVRRSATRRANAKARREAKARAELDKILGEWLG